MRPAPLLLLALVACSSPHHAAAPGATTSPTGSALPASTAPATSAPSAAASAPASAAPTGATTAPAGPATPSGSPAATLAAPGTYDITVDGSESFAGTTRTYPAASTLTVSGSGDARSMTVRFSKDRDDTYAVGIAGRSVRLRRSDSRVRLLGYERDTVLVPDPPILLFPAGAEPGRTFSGSYAGAIHGTYTGRVEDDGSVTVTVTFHGDAEGSTTTRTWWDAAHLRVLKQRLDTDVTSGGQHYAQHVTWTLR